MKNSSAGIEAGTLIGSFSSTGKDAARRAFGWHPHDLLEAHRVRNARTWAALERLGAEEGIELPVAFFFETAGREADRELADFMGSEPGYRVVVEPEGVSGWTAPLRLSPTALDGWVEAMLWAGHTNGGCRFAGWTATITRSAAERILPP